MTSHASSFAPWATAAPLANDAETASASSGGSEALERAAADLSQAAAQLADLARQQVAVSSANGGGNAPLALQITVTSPLGDDEPFSASSMGPDLSLLS